MRLTLLGIVGAAALATTLTACGKSGDASAADCTPVDSSISVGALDKLKFDAAEYEAGAGCVEVTYKNEGSIAHTLLVKGRSGFKLSVGDEDTGRLKLEPGLYQLYCDVAGHGTMRAELTIG